MAQQRLLLLVALMQFQWVQLTTAARPVAAACCPVTKTYLETPRPRTALMTFPGSGNTWVRHIIETLRGYHTTSVYCDRGLQPVFKAECDSEDRHNRSIVVKTHRFDTCPTWQRAVVVIRNPLYAIRGEYQQKRARSHTGYIAAKDWDWDDWHMFSRRWCAMWTRDFARLFSSEAQPGCADRPTAQYKVFFYEDLKTSSGDLNPYFLDGLLKELNINKADSYYDCALNFNQGYFARKLPAGHPAAKVINDTGTLEIFEAAGCATAYRAYRSRFPGLPQPIWNASSSIVHVEQ